MQRHATSNLLGRLRTLGGSLALLLIGTGFYAQNAHAQTEVTIDAAAKYACDFENAYCDFNEQSKIEPGRRSSFVSSIVSGARAVKLTTLPGDNSVHGSGTWERNDLSKGPDGSYCNAGQEEWWAFSIMFPDDYVFPPGPEAGILMDFHHNASSGQANYEIQTIPGIGLRARGYGGSSINNGKYDALIPDPYGATNNVTKNQWYHFVLHVRWSPNGDGLMEGWLNGRQYQSYQGPTLYSGIACYFKLANYHAPFGQASSVVYDRVVRGATAASVSHLALDGVPSTGTLTPSQPQSSSTYALSTITMGTGTGTVSSSPSGINCGSSCSSSFAPNSAVTLTAKAATGSTFTGWSGACSGTGSCTVTMSGAKSVTANFNSATSTAPASGGSGASVSVSQLGFNGTAGSQKVTYTNNTGAKITFIKASISSGKFQQTNNCGDVAAGASCTATVTYYPSNSGSTTATFTMTSTAPNSPHLVTLSATGSTIAATTTAPTTTTASATSTSGVTVSSSSLAFDSSNRTRTVTFTNNSGAKVTFIQASISSGKYQQTNNCGDVPAGGSCTATLTYYPTNGGSDTATFTMTSSAANSPARVTLTATPGKRLVTL